MIPTASDGRDAALSVNVGRGLCMSIRKDLGLTGKHDSHSAHGSALAGHRCG